MVRVLTPGNPAMALSVTAPISPAIERTKLILFQPFEIGKWFVLGFCAFLAFLGQGGGGSGNWGQGQFNQQGGSPPSGQQITDWITDHLALIAVVAMALLLVSIAVGGFFIWLSSRGKFMFLDGVVRNRGAVAEPWTLFRDLANSLALFRFVFSLVVSAVMLSILGIALIVVWPDLRANQFGGASLAAVVGGGLVFFGVAIVAGVIQALLEDFVIPAMYLFDLPVMSAWSVVRTEVLAGRFWTIVLYFLMKLALGLAIGVIAIVATCATCCVVAIPYLGTVILLPLVVFIRCYPLYFLEQLGPDWLVFEPPQVVTEAPPLP